MPPTGLGDGKDRDRDRDPHLSQHNAGLQQTVLRPKQELALGKFMGKMFQNNIFMKKFRQVQTQDSDLQHFLMLFKNLFIKSS